MKKSSVEIGKEYGRLTAIEKATIPVCGHYRWKCRCSCGNEVEVYGHHLVKGHTLSCGCLHKENMSKKGVRKIRDLTGEIFGRLTVIRRNLEECRDGRSAYWLCKCSCGNEKTICGANLIQGTKSCGCFAKELISLRGKQKHLPQGEASFNAIFYYYKRNAAIRNYAFALKKEEFKEFVTGKCHYCGASESNLKKTREATGNFAYNGIDRVDNTKGYNKDNCVSCCKICNRMKLTMTQKEFAKWIATAYEHWAKQAV